MANFTGGGNTTQDINNDDTLYNDTRLFTGTEQVSALEPVNSGQKSPFLALWMGSGRSNFFVIAPAAKRGTNFGIGSTSNPILVVASSSLSAAIASGTQHEALWLYQNGTRSFLRMGHTDLAIEDYTGARRVAINNDGTIGLGRQYDPNVKLWSNFSVSDPSNALVTVGHNFIMTMDITLTKSSGVITTYNGITNQFTINASSTQTISVLEGFVSDMSTAANSTTNVSTLFHYIADDATLSGTGTVNGQYGFVINGFTTGINNYGVYLTKIGTANGIGAVTFTGGLYYAAGTVSLGDQTATTTDVAQIWLGIQTFTSTTNTRTVTNLTSIYIQGAPVAGTNITATNGPYSIWVAGGTSRFDGNLILRNGQNLTISAASQTVGAATLTVPDFAGVNDTFAFITLAQTLSNKTLSSPTLSGTVSGTPTWSSNQAITLSTAAQPNITSVGTLTSLSMGGTLTVGANTLSLVSATVSGTPTWSSNQAITLSTAAQPNITSVGTLTSITTSGALTLTASASTIIPGVTSLSLRNNANNADNFILTDAGIGTMRNMLYINAAETNTTFAGTLANATLIFPGGSTAIRNDTSHNLNFDSYNGGSQFTMLKLGYTTGNLTMAASAKIQPTSGVAGFSVNSTALTLGSVGSIIIPEADMGNAANDAARDTLAGNVNGAMAADTVGVAGTYKIWFRVGGAWKAATIA